MGRTLWTWTQRITLSLIALVVVLASTARVYRAYQRQVAKTTAIDRIRGIDEATFVRIG